MGLVGFFAWEFVGALLGWSFMGLICSCRFWVSLQAQVNLQMLHHPSLLSPFVLFIIERYCKPDIG
jgi:hypothetical protein